MNPALNYILEQEQPYKDMLLHIQLIVEKTVPEARMGFKYRIPFYYVGTRPLCYLNKSKDFVDVGFWHSAHLSKHIDKMEKAGRKVVRSLRYYSLEEINNTVLEEVLLEAYSFKEKGFWKK